MSKRRSAALTVRKNTTQTPERKRLPKTFNDFHSLGYAGPRATQGRERLGSPCCSDSNSFSDDIELSPAALLEKDRKKYAQDFGFLTPENSPKSSLTLNIKRSSARVTMIFLDLPIEVHQLICSYLPTDRDVARYAQICTKTNNCVTSSVWRRRFLCTFDPIEHATPKELHHQYVQRRKLSQINIEFHRGSHPLHSRCLSILKDLIIQSNAKKIVTAGGYIEVYGRNHEFISQLIRGAAVGRSRCNNIVDAICQTDGLFYSNRQKSGQSSNSLVLIIQLCLVHLCLDPYHSYARAPRFHESQQQVYKCYTQEPIFKGKNKEDINFPWLLHVANFFKFHFKQPGGEGMLAHMYSRSLNESERPRKWCGKLKMGTYELGKRWKGSFAYLDFNDLAAIRYGDDNGRNLIVDETSEGNNGFQDLTIFFDIQGHPELRFPDRLEEILHGKPFGPLRDHLNQETSFPETKDFFGLGYDGKQYHFNGRIHGMPPQQGIPGFQRVTMIKYLPDEEGHYGFGQTSGWAYEGCVLPGNEIMLGRWWRVEPNPAEQEPAYSGPFIFWGVEGTAEDKAKDVTSALKFLEAIGENVEW